MRWVVAGGSAVLSGSSVVTGVSALGIAIGAVMSGSDVIGPVVGSLVLGLYGAALGGIGVAVGGLTRTSLAAPVVAVLTIVTWFLDIVGPALGLPDAVQQVALTSHYGFTMLGQWDPVGIIVSVGLAAGGVLLGAWGFRQRDLQA